MSTHIPVSTERTPSLIEHILKAGLVPMLHGSPGIGKSSISQQLAKKLGLKVIDLRLSQSDPTDLNGFPAIDKENEKAGYLPMDTFPIEGDSIPEGYKGWLLLLDEFNSAPLSVQAAAYKLVLDKQVGQHKLHENVYSIAAGNLETDGAITNRISTAMQSRMVHMEIQLDPESWTTWASQNNIDHRVVSFIGFRPELLHKFDPDHNDFTFPCGRTWEFVSKLCKGVNSNELSDFSPAITGAVGPGAGNEFITYCKIYKQLPSIDQILADPKNTPVSDEPSVLYAITGMLADKANDKNFDDMIQYIRRMPPEFQVITVQNAFRRNPIIQTTKAWEDWLDERADDVI